ncbi:MAG: sodium-translocating pyrophosphatase [Fastidiosipila sp.]|nr:sodium-translocating pyrophosphatase [Fastidiosipila sp.]
MKLNYEIFSRIGLAITAVIALVAAYLIYRSIKVKPTGNKRMQEIASFIREGAMVFLSRQYRFIMMFIVVMFIVLLALLGWPTAIAFVMGGLFSVLAGFFGMRTATLANVRTTEAARSKGMSAALRIAFSGGSVMGLSVVGLGLLGISVIYQFSSEAVLLQALTGFGLGASSMALFGRVGGGIYTKAADVGADLVGKLEAGIPEDDPRNPAVIADNVGDNVGDVAGMGSDLFESYVGSIISAITLAVTLPLALIGNRIAAVSFPLLLGGAGALFSLIAIFIVTKLNIKNPAKILNAGTYISSLLTMLAALGLSYWLFNTYQHFIAVTSGLVAGVLIGTSTEYFTSADYKPVKNLAKACKTGSATNIIEGFSLGMGSSFVPIMLIAGATYAAYRSVGLYGVALAAVGMLSTVGMTISVDAYGPIADNAGGIAQMSDLPHEVREITDKLDSVGNTTAAIGKGFAIGSAALTALALFVSYAQISGLTAIDLLNPNTIIGLFIGGAFPFLFSALTMNSVGKAAFQMIEEVRRQFRNEPGIIAGTVLPDYNRCIEISTNAALREMILPGVLAVLGPIIMGIILGPAALGGMLAGALVTGVVLAITLSNSGGAWDNAKKYIEEGHVGGPGSEAHRAAVVGDTVGDPFKDTSGPSINILIKLMTIVSMVFAPFF